MICSGPMTVQSPFGPFLILLMALLTIPQAQARLLVVSDIDDTLKVSHVRSPMESARFAQQTDVVFAGMSELFQAIAKQGDVQFVYVSNAPAWLMDGAHQALIKNNRFPKGDVILRAYSDDRATFKANVLRRLLKSIQPDRVLLFGDNGENDPKFYSYLIQANPGKDIHAFIHALYPTNNPGSQFSDRVRPFASAYDLMIQVERVVRIAPGDHRWVQDVVNEYATLDLKDESERQVVFPKWIQCHPGLSLNDFELGRQWVEILSMGCRRGYE